MMTRSKIMQTFCLLWAALMIAGCSDPLNINETYNDVMSELDFTEKITDITSIEKGKEDVSYTLTGSWASTYQEAIKSLDNEAILAWVDDYYAYIYRLIEYARLALEYLGEEPVTDTISSVSPTSSSLVLLKQSWDLALSNALGAVYSAASQYEALNVNALKKQLSSGSITAQEYNEQRYALEVIVTTTTEWQSEMSTKIQKMINQVIYSLEKKS